jgi:hypothetical protein
MSYVRLIPLAFLVLAIGCASDKPVAHRPKTREPGKRLDARSIAIVSAATKVEVFRIDPMDGPHQRTPKLLGQNRIGGYLVTKQGTDPGADFIARLVDTLFDDSAYSDEFAKCYDPGVVYRVWKDDEALDVIICYRCHNAYIGPPTERANENVSLLGKRWSDLVDLAKQAFPNDPVFDELK